MPICVFGLHWSLSTNTAIPLHLEGIKVLGCPLGADDYCSRLLKSVIAKVEDDLHHLRQFPHIHQRIKMTIYCCNTRISYILRTVPLALVSPHVHEHDRMFDNFMANTLAFEENYQNSAHAQSYLRGLQQCRLGIKQGGMGLTRAAVVSPAPCT